MKLTLAVAVLAILAGCGKEVSFTGNGWIDVGANGGSAGVKEVEMPSGRRCVVLVGYYKGAISCDWSK